MKGTASINPIFQSQSTIQSPQIFNIHPLTVADNRSHSVHFRNATKKIQPKIIINTCYSQRYGALMILTEDGRLRIYTQSFDQITRIPWQSKYSVGLQFLDQKNAMLMIGATQVQLLYVKVHSNIKSTKFISSMNFNIEKQQKYIVQPETRLQWNKGFNINLKHNLLYLWSSKDVNFYNLKSLQLLAHIPHLTRKQLSITYVHYNIGYKYTITGLINGHIKVWRLPINTYTPITSQQQQQTTKQYILIHNYIKHTKGIDKIIQVNFKGIKNNEKQNNVIISSSLELTVCFWSLETFQLLRFYDFQAQYTSVFLYDSLYSLAIKDNYLGVLNWGKNLEFITDITSQIISFDKYRPEYSFDCSKNVESVQITLGSNIGFQICDYHLDAKDLNKTQIQYIYPPLKAKGIQQIVSSPYTANQYYLLVQNGDIFRLRIQDNSGRIQQSYQIQRAKDIQFHQLNQLPSIMNFLPVIPPKFDTEINQTTFEKQEQPHNISNNKQETYAIHSEQYYQNKKDKYFQLKLIAIGCTKGAIIFFRISDFQHIYTRVTYHREAINQLQSVTDRRTGDEYLVSHCMENYLKVIKFDMRYQKASCLASIYTGGYMTKMKCFQDRVALVFKKGLFEVFQLKETGPVSSKQEIGAQLHCYPNVTGDDHQLQIYTLDYDTSNELILTAGADNTIKIWTYYKVLIYEVYLDDGLKGAIWFRDKQMIVSHNFKILYFRRIGLKLAEGEIEGINQEYIEKGVQKMQLRDVLKSIHRLHQQDIGHKQDIGIGQQRMIKIEHKGQSPRQKQSKRQSNISSPSHHKPQIFKQQLQLSQISQTKPPKLSQPSSTRRPVSNKRKKTHSKHKVNKSHTVIQQEQIHRNLIPDSDLSAMRKHLQDMKQIKKQANQSILPKIGPKNQDMFDNFMKSKLLNKKILTRRDITLNRIIMKNIIREHFGNDSDVANNLKLDF